MPREFSRTDRLAQLLQRELAQLIQREVKDPRLGFVTITAATVSKDLSYAKVYITVLGDSEQASQSVKILNQAAGYLRSTLAKRIKVRKMPELQFIYDNTIAEAERLDALIERANKDHKAEP